MVALRAALLVVALLAAACGGAGSTAGASSAAPSGELTVLAAASLADAFGEIAEQVQDEHAGMRVTLGVAGSQQLAAQIVDGVAADVFASADAVQMQVVADAELLAGEPVTFTANRLVVAVAPDNPRGVTRLADLARDDLAVVLPAPNVPAGRAAREVLHAAGVRVAPVSLEADVRATLSKVLLGEADAGIVYASDVVAAGDSVDGIAIADELNPDVRYPVAVLADAGNPTAARAFVAHLRSSEAQSVLADFGFADPPPPEAR